MKRLMGIDYGIKKTGLSVTDPLQIIVSPLATVATKDLFDYLREYFSKEDVAKVVIGEPFMADGETPAQHHDEVLRFVKRFKNEFEGIEVELFDETFTSVQAREIVYKSVASRKKRRNKSLVDKVAATLILQKYLNHI